MSSGFSGSRVSPAWSHTCPSLLPTKRRQHWLIEDVHRGNKDTKGDLPVVAPRTGIMGTLKKLWSL